MGIHFEKTDLPGIGVRHDMVTKRGRHISIITERDGGRQLSVFDPADSDSCSDAIDLNDTEASALADVLGASVMLSRMTKLSDELAGLFTEQIELPTDSPFLNRALGDTKARTLTHSSIVAIVRDGELIPTPTPSMILRPGDLLVTVGTRPGLDLLTKLLTDGRT